MMTLDDAIEHAHCIETVNDEGIFGHAHCSVCQQTISPCDRFCRHCGAKITGTDYQHEGDQMEAIIIHPFRMGTVKEAALKPLEEASEAHAAWQDMEYLANDDTRQMYHEALADEIADTIQACVNLAARYGIDLPAAMRRCEERNRERGHYD